MDQTELQERKAGRGPEECREIDKELEDQQKNSCLQYLNIHKAERTGHVTVAIHLPISEEYGEEWFKASESYSDREKQDLTELAALLEKVCLPMEVDSLEWNELEEAAFKTGIAGASENLHKMAMEGPYRPGHLQLGVSRFIYPTEDLRMVGICCPQDPKEPTYLVSVSECGELNDHLAIPP